jgi:hypothetical protein
LANNVYICLLNTRILTETYLIEKLKSNFKGRDVFSREELFEFLLRFNPKLLETTFRWRIFDLKKKHIIRSVSKTKFTLQYQPAFIPFIEPKLKALYKDVKKNFPHTKICVWNTKWLNEFMLHQPGRFLTIIEVEADAASSVFNYFKDTSHKNVFIDPQKKEIENYLYDDLTSIVVLSLVTKAPTVIVDSVVTASLEKILVDIFSNPELFNTFQGQERNLIFENAFSRNSINTTRLFHYATRRNKKAALEEYINNHLHLPIALEP